MKKTIAFLVSVAICFLAVFCAKAYLEAQIASKYYDKAGDILTENKFKSLALQKAAASTGDNLFMFGSSEFEAGAAYDTHASKFFNNKKDGFQVNLIGKAGYKTLVHAVDFGALGPELKGQKVVFVLSPQWFTKGGINENTFEANSSELQVYGYFFNSSLSRNLKVTMANRILQISRIKPNKDFETMRDFCRLYSKNDIVSRGMTYLMTPYYWMRYEILSLKEDIQSYNLLSKNKNIPQNVKGGSATFNWNGELQKAVTQAKRSSTNKFGMDDTAYKNLIKGNLQKLKNSSKNSSYKISPEYNDLKLLLDICKDQGIKPLILNIPVNGKWYDYTGFSKSDREAYYKKVDQIVASYGFQVADFSNHEYEDYFLKDASHLGWKGWVYVDKAIDEYYHEN